MQFRLSLPYPPSGNNYKRHFCTRSSKQDPHTIRATLTPRTRAYKSQAGWLAKSQGARILTGDVRVVIDATPSAKAQDADNITKVLFDTLNGIAWEDDKQIKQIVINILPAGRTAKVEMLVSDINHQEERTSETARTPTRHPRT